MRATVITDASFCPKTKAGGWACWITPDVGTRVKLSGKFQNLPESATFAELWSAYNGLAVAYKMGARVILLQSDCMTVGTAISKPNGKHGFGPFRDEHIPDAVVQFRHVKGHTNDPAARSYVNRWCDAEAKRHMRELRDMPGELR